MRPRFPTLRPRFSGPRPGATNGPTLGGHMRALGLGDFLLVVLAANLNLPLLSPLSGPWGRKPPPGPPLPASRVCLSAAPLGREGGLGRVRALAAGSRVRLATGLARPRLGALQARPCCLPGGERGPLVRPLPVLRCAPPPSPLRPGLRPGAVTTPFGSSFPLLPTPFAVAGPHTSVLEPNQAVSVSCRGCKTSPFGAWNLTLRRLIPLRILFPGGCTTCCSYYLLILSTAHFVKSPSVGNVVQFRVFFFFSFVFAFAFLCYFVSGLTQSTHLLVYIFLIHFLMLC